MIRIDTDAARCVSQTGRLYDPTAVDICRWLRHVATVEQRTKVWMELHHEQHAVAVLRSASDAHASWVNWASRWLDRLGCRGFDGIWTDEEARDALGKELGRKPVGFRQAVGAVADSLGSEEDGPPIEYGPTKPDCVARPEPPRSAVKAARERAVQILRDAELDDFADELADARGPRPYASETTPICGRAAGHDTCVDCGHSALEHAVDDEERRECSRCPCQQFRCVASVSGSITEAYTTGGAGGPTSGNAGQVEYCPDCHGTGEVRTGVFFGGLRAHDARPGTGGVKEWRRPCPKCRPKDSEGR